MPKCGITPLIASTLVLVAIASCAQEPSPIETESGYVQGILEDGVHVYKGISFAAPPVGELRWRPPEVAKSWEGVQLAQQYGAHCPQNQPSIGPAPDGNMSEDCLTLNIWTPVTSEDASLPVMIWIHGGGYLTGAGALPHYNGTALAKQGVVLVSINYRLGVLGFFAHPALSAAQAGEPLGNYGLMDQIAALEWVQKNIAGFGGDPNNVTIFGESAGGGSVNYLMVATNTEGLFHRAVCQSSSGGLQPEPLLKQKSGRRLAVEEQGEILESLLGLEQQPNVIAALRDTSFEDVVNALDPRISPRPMVDGEIITDKLGILFAQGKQHDVPYLAGGNSWEASLGHAVGGGFSPQVRARSLTPEIAETLYAEFDETQIADQWFADSVTLAPSRYLTSQMSNVSSPAFRYYLSYLTESLRGKQPGVAHGDDIPYIFQTLDTVFDEVSERDREVSTLMSAYWVQFAKTGNPNGEGLPEWPEYKREQDLILGIGDEVRVMQGFLSERLNFHEERSLKSLTTTQ